MRLNEELRLRTMIKAMSEVIIPAIDPKQLLAMDQAKIVLASLGLLLDQCGKSYRFDVAEIRSLALCLRETLDCVEDGGRNRDLRTEAERVLEALDAVSSLRLPQEFRIYELAAEAKRCLDAIVSEVHADPDRGRRQRVARSIMAHSGRQLRRERAWVRATGFDDCADVPSLEELLSE